MWIVKLALNRPYTFIVLAILILIAAPVVIARTPTDIFPSIDIPVVSVAFQYTGLQPEELNGRLTDPYEKVLTTLVDNIQHIEATTMRGQAIVKVYLQPGASVVASESKWADRVAFRNPHGEIVVVMANQSEKAEPVAIAIDGSQSEVVTLPARSFDTFSYSP